MNVEMQHFPDTSGAITVCLAIHAASGDQYEIRAIGERGDDGLLVCPTYFARPTDARRKAIAQVIRKAPGEFDVPGVGVVRAAAGETAHISS